MCVFVHKICEEMFGGSRMSFSWVGQKVSKKIDVCGHDGDDSSTVGVHGHRMTLCPGKTSRRCSVF